MDEKRRLGEKRRSPTRRSAHDLYFRRHNLEPPNEQGSPPRKYSRFANRPPDVPKSFRARRRESPERSSTRNWSNSSQEHPFYTRRSPIGDKKERENNSKPAEAKGQATESRHKSSNEEPDFITSLQVIPTNTFIETIRMLLDYLKINGLSDLSELLKLEKCISMSQTLCKSLPPEIKNAIKDMLPSEAELNRSKSPFPQPETAQVSELTSKKEEADMSVVSKILKLARREPMFSDISSATSNESATSAIPSRMHASSTIPSRQHASSTIPSRQHASSTMPSHQYASSSVSPYQNCQSYPGVPYGQDDIPHASIYASSSNESFAYSAASSSNMTPAVPTLTSQEQRDSYSAYNVYQSQYSQRSFPDRNNRRY